MLRRRVGNRNPKVVPASEAPMADGRDVAYHAGSAALFPRLVRAIGRPDLEVDPRFATHALRVANQDELYGIVDTWISGHTGVEVVEVLTASGVPASVVNSSADILADPHVAERGTFEMVEDAELGTLPLATPVPRLSATPGRTRHTGQPLGSATDAVLTGLLGLSRAEVDDLHRRGVTGPHAAADPDTAGAPSADPDPGEVSDRAP